MKSIIEFKKEKKMIKNKVKKKNKKGKKRLEIIKKN